MSLDRTALAQAVARHGAVVRIVVAEVQGSAPRDTGTSMLVWADGEDGTIGGGTLEYDATAAARDMLARGEARRFRTALLGPDLGQCCGGAVALLYERWDSAALAGIGDGLHLRAATETAPATPPLAAERLRAQARHSGARPDPRLIDGWFAEPVTGPATPVWIWGAGHVGRALVATLATLPDLSLTWVDTAPERFPDTIPAGVTALPAPEIATAARLAPPGAHHLVLTFSHALDFALCDALLHHGFASLGLIGSATKWARFRTRLRQAGHGDAAIGRIQCPIGVKALGKHPQAIAVGVAYGLLMGVAKKEATRPAPHEQGDGDDGRAADA
ncbi:xanthine dehydrogenase accessory protein XdhC [Sinisalibacter aestuarii]|uniref:Xanthine dehydrogenase accessory protein XdhC n=1 Tax=Sinisalibacter aestuarii TaxID=2949426 RepID=A0ABQ5LR28_9RHOB|nr:xanthine dehydrogenase accessory protein XdhC [Sinisalibacter aestuarii]GKY87451.1 xanthine dehydrogenase accessory protein XdhC [Sinisalibacter aestuarii]